MKHQIKDVVLFKFPPIGDIPTASNFCLKLEIYLQARQIEYTSKIVNNPGKAPYKKLPFIRFKENGNDKVLADSTQIIQYFEQEVFEQSFDAHLTLEQKAISTAYQRLLEDSFYFSLIYYLWIDDDSWPSFKALRFPGKQSLKSNLLIKFSRRYLKKMIYLQGIGKYPKDFIYRKAEADIKAISDHLADQAFFFGEQPSLIDLIIYSVTAVLRLPQSAIDTESEMSNISQKYPNLRAHAQRVHQRFWADD